MKIVVFGGSGFIGTRLVARLVEGGHDVLIADISPSAAYPNLHMQCDVRDPMAVRAACENRDLIYNLAAIHRDDVRPRSLYREVNVDGASVICDAARGLGIKTIIFTSSVAIYGFSAEELDEDAKPAPFNDYGITKLEAERVHEAWAAEDPERSLVMVRPTVVFGEGNRGNVFTLIDQIARGRFLMVGDGTNVKSIAYVENVAAFLAHTLGCSAGVHVFNYVDKPDFTTRDLVHVLRRHLGKTGDGMRMPYGVAATIGIGCDAVAAVLRRRLPFSRIRVTKFCSPSRFSSARAMASGFSPPVPLAEGLRRTIAHEFPGVGATLSPQIGTRAGIRSRVETLVQRWPGKTS